MIAPLGERFILRSSAGDRTLGGGRILAPARTRRGAARGTAERLAALAGAQLDVQLSAALDTSGARGCEIAALARLHGLPEADIRRRLQALPEAQLAGGLALHRGAIEALERTVRDALAAYHARHPLRAGASLAQLRAALAPGTPEAAMQAALQSLLADGTVAWTNGHPRLATHDPLGSCSSELRSLVEALESSFREARWTPPGPPRRDQASAGYAAYRLLVARGKLLELGSHTAGPVALHCDALSEARAVLTSAFPPPRMFTVSEARQVLGSTRKFVVPLLEFLDAARFTRRSGDRRILARDTTPRANE